MSKLNFQFHATIEELYKFINKLLVNKGYKAYGVILYPMFEIEEITQDSEISPIKVYETIIISKKELIDYKNYREFINNQENNLGIDNGCRNENIIRESRMWIFAEGAIDKEWKSIISSYKRELLKGAWGFMPSKPQNKVYYKNHRYTAGAKEAQEKGIHICAFAGNCEFELKDSGM